MRKVPLKGSSTYTSRLVIRIAARKDKNRFVKNLFMMQYCLRQFFRNHCRFPDSLNLFEETDSEPAIFVVDLLLQTATNSNAFCSGAIGHVGPPRVATLQQASFKNCLGSMTDRNLIDNGKATD